MTTPRLLPSPLRLALVLLAGALLGGCYNKNASDAYEILIVTGSRDTLADVAEVALEVGDDEVDRKRVSPGAEAPEPTIVVRQRGLTFVTSTK